MSGDVRGGLCGWEITYDASEEVCSGSLCYSTGAYVCWVDLTAVYEACCIHETSVEKHKTGVVQINCCLLCSPYVSLKLTRI